MLIVEWYQLYFEDATPVAMSTGSSVVSTISWKITVTLIPCTPDFPTLAHVLLIYRKWILMICIMCWRVGVATLSLWCWLPFDVVNWLCFATKQIVYVHGFMVRKVVCTHFTLHRVLHCFQIWLCIVHMPVCMSFKAQPRNNLGWMWHTYEACDRVLILHFLQGHGSHEIASGTEHIFR